MSLTQIFILAVIAILLGQLKKHRSLALMAFSAFSIYWLQPVQSPINLTFWLPTLTLLIVVFLWWLLFSDDNIDWQQNAVALIVISMILVLMGANRYFHFEQIFITDTPRLQWIGFTAAIMLVPALPITRFPRIRFFFAGLVSLGLLLLLLVVKLPSMQTAALIALASFRGKTLPGEAFAVSWLGFSYIVFRLIHTIVDRRSGRLRFATLPEYVNYVVFFPTVVAGPIDRLDRFTKDLNEPVALDSHGWVDAGTRFFMGLFKKFVLADSLAWIALNEYSAGGLRSTGWIWVLLYAYSFRIYFDFSGYTDVAIGLSRFLGIRLPENFDAPYLKPNLTMFWYSWHMTLTQWFRSYLFNPLTRLLRSNKSIPSYLVILITQVVTMTTIGLWHGITLNFVYWGLWHGVGLFIQNRWSSFMRGRATSDERIRPVRHGLNFINVFLTFNYVSIGWLFFMFPTPALALQSVMHLFGVWI